jgi:hypothetical protein
MRGLSIVCIVPQIYDDDRLSVPSSYGRIHRDPFAPFVNNRSVCLVNMSKNVHPAFLELVQRRG